MSYGFVSPCFNCEKSGNTKEGRFNPEKKTCTDSEDIQEGIGKIHSKLYEQGHQGSGTIVLSCQKVKPIWE